MTKNLGNFPFARDRHVVPEWRWSSKNEEWYAWLPAEEDKKNVRFWLRDGVDAQLQRFPTGFDAHVLWYLLAQATVTGNATVAIRPANVLRAMDLSVQSGNRARLADALRYWTSAQVTWQRWHYVGNQKPAPKSLPPPIRSLRKHAVTLDKEWRQLAEQGYFVKLTLPLPTHAAAQNAILVIKTGIYPGEVSSFCRKIGINHSTRTRQLVVALKLAQDYFTANGGALEWEIENGKLRLTHSSEPEARQPKKPPAAAQQPKLTPQRPQIEWRRAPIQGSGEW
jgi:hypothetical protein